MAKTAVLSTIIDAEVKKAVGRYCKRTGVKLRYLVEKSLVEQLEDEIDLNAYHERRNEPTVPLEEILKRRKTSS